MIATIRFRLYEEKFISGICACCGEYTDTAYMLYIFVALPMVGCKLPTGEAYAIPSYLIPPYVLPSACCTMCRYLDEEMFICDIKDNLTRRKILCIGGVYQ